MSTESYNAFLSRQKENKVVCHLISNWYINAFPANHDFERLLTRLHVYLGRLYCNNMDPDQTAPWGAV